MSARPATAAFAATAPAAALGRIGAAIGNRLAPLLLVAPLLVFLGVFFLWPLATIFNRSVADPVVADAFPGLALAIADWAPGTAPTEAMQAALVADLRAAQDPQAVGDAIRRLNSQKSGFRSLFGKTDTAAKKPGPVDLAAVDRRWAEPEWWGVIASAMPRWTDRFLLAAVDLQHGQAGAIEKVPAAQAVHLPTLLRTFGVSAIVTLLCALIGLPYAMLAAAVTGWKRTLLLAGVLIPMWTSILVRCTAWYIILQGNGLINGLLLKIGLIREALPLLFSRPGVILAMTHVMLPFMVLSIFSVLIALPKALMPAAASLGAGPLRAFVYVLLPLSLRGVAAGSLLVFMTSLGFYILPALLGGAQDQFVSAMVAFYAVSQANWPMAAALGLVLLATTLLIHMLYQRLAGRDARI